MDADLDLLFDHLRDLGAAIFSKDLAGRYSSMNGAGCAVLNAPMSKIIGHTDQSLFDPASAKLVRERDYDIVSNNKTKSYSSLAHCSGSWTLFRSAKMILRSPRRTPIGLLGISFALDLRSHKSESELVTFAFEQMVSKPQEFQSAFLRRHLLSNRLVPDFTSAP